MGQRKHKFNHIRGANVPTWEAHWYQLANMIEPFVYGGDEVIGQITLTACFESCRSGRLLVLLARCYPNANRKSRNEIKTPKKLRDDRFESL